MSRKLFYILATLYALSIICGIVLLSKSSIPSGDKENIATGLFTKESIAVVQIYGPIYISQKSSGFGLSQNADKIVRRLTKINEDKNIKAVLLRINSPGGSVAAVQEICKEIGKLKANGKIVVASIGDVAASGGYYIASQADKIVASPGSLTGSIGVILQVSSINELLKKVGVKVETVKSGKMKDIGSPYKDLSENERKVLQALIDDAYEDFVKSVADGRNLKISNVKELADGRIFTGNQAKKLGLIDEFGNYQDSVELTAKLAGIKYNPKIINDQESHSLWQLFDLFGNSEIKIVPQIIMAERRIRLDYMME